MLFVLLVGLMAKYFIFFNRPMQQRSFNNRLQNGILSCIFMASLKLMWKNLHQFPPYYLKLKIFLEYKLIKFMEKSIIYLL